MGDCGVGDSLSGLEQFHVAQAAAADFPAHEMALRRNADGMTWAVLLPRTRTPALLQFTFCRIAPCIVVEIVDHAGRRQFCSEPTLERALALARHVSEQAILADAEEPRSAVLH